MTNDVRFDIKHLMNRDTRPISWVKAARKAFNGFPATAREQILRALTIAAEGQTARIAKPMKGLGSGVFEIAVRHHGDTFRIIYAVQIGEAIWVVHAFQKKSKRGIETPSEEIDVVRTRLARLKERLQ